VLTTKTDNAFLADKAALRWQHLPDGERLRVMDCYAGSGKVWPAVKKLSGRRIDVLPIDTWQDLDELVLPGDNRVYLASLDLQRFDVIDLDAYGVPFEQLEQLFAADYRGTVFATFIQVQMGVLPSALLRAVGFSQAMIAAAGGLCHRGGFDHLRAYLAQKGVRQIWQRQYFRKHYFGFRTLKTA
jgi:hypothetical protein